MRNEMNEELTAKNLYKQLEGFLDAMPYPKSKDAHKAKADAQALMDFIVDTFEMEDED